MSGDYITLPRLYVNQDFNSGKEITLEEGHAHYLRTVMRKQDGDQIRVFNGRDGEWLTSIVQLGKRKALVSLVQRLRAQDDSTRKVQLLFCPIRKHRLDFLIEKAVELGVTDLHPITTNRSDIRKINEKRLQAQVIEAAEQCERLDIPTLHPITALTKKIAQWPKDTLIYVCLERGEDEHIKTKSMNDDLAFIVGPTGGFEPEETQRFLENKTIKPISLGKTVYRAETACIICLVHAQNP